MFTSSAHACCWRKDCELSRAQFLAELMQRLRTYETKAAQRGQMQVAVNSARLTG